MSNRPHLFLATFDLFLFGLLFLFSLLSLSVYSQEYALYGIIGDRLGIIDPTTGTATEVASLTPGFSSFSGLTYEPNLDLLLAIADRSTDPRLVSIDRCSGEVTEIGFVDQQSPFLDIKLIEAMEYNPDDGLLYASGYELNPSQNWFSSRRLLTIDPLTGNATIVATISGTCQNDVDAMAFTANAKYVVDGCPNPNRLYTIDLGTGSTTYIGSYNVASGVILAVHPISGGLYSTMNGGGRTLYGISTTTGAETLIGQTHEPGDFGGGVIVQMAFAPSLDQDGDGYTICQGDCNDGDPTINPGAIDICDNIDNDCDGEIDEDIDPDPISSIENLIALIASFVQSGEIAVNKATPLTNKLLQVIEKLDDDPLQTQAALNQLNAFNNQLSAFISNGSIDPETGAVLQGIKDCLSYSIDNGNFRIAPQEGASYAGVQSSPFHKLSTKQDNNSIDVQIFPNPTTGSFVVKLPHDFTSPLTVSIYNAVGQEVFQLLKQDWPASQLSIDLTSRDLPNGIYWLAIQTSEDHQVQQLILRR